MSSTPGFESGKNVEPQTTYHRLQTKADGSSNLPGAIFFQYVGNKVSEHARKSKDFRQV